MSRGSLLLASLLAAGCAHPPPARPTQSEATLCAQKLVQAPPGETRDPCAQGCADTRDAAGWLDVGLDLLRDGKLEEARDSFVRALRHDGQLVRGYNDFGIVALRLGQHRDAECLFHRALELDPDYANARYNLALNYLGAQQLAKAHKELTILASSHADLPDLWLLLGVVRMQQGAPQDAVDLFMRALQLEPRKARYWNGLGVAYAQLYRYADAEYALRACLDVDPRDVACQQSLDLARARGVLPQPELLAKP